VPLYFLYELSVIVAQFAWRKRGKRQARLDAEASSPHNAGAPA
jgi:Sec-independent protein secretion pathway component TatC